VTLQATLFDMDGLLIDSEILWHKAEVEIFGRLGVPISESKDRATKGMFVVEVVNYWYERYPWSGPSGEEVVMMLLERSGTWSSRRVGCCRARTALDLTSAGADRAGQLYSAGPDLPLLDHFACVSASRRFTRRSSSSTASPIRRLPHGGAVLGVRPQSCLVVEDSAAGVLAAKAAP